MQRILGALAVASAAFLAVGCSSTAKPPFPTDPDPCASYCLVWVPPVYRDVPKLVCEKPSCTKGVNVCYDRTRFTSVEVPGCYTEKCVPDECRTYAIVQATPARVDWQEVECEDGCGRDVDCCWKPVRTPPTFEVCEKVETDLGYEYCAFTPPQHKIVATTERCVERVEKYVPPEYRVQYVKELYSPGRYEWQMRYCDEVKRQEKVVCAPCTSCARCPKGQRAGFEYCPPKD
jgi:hypothetical protein